MVIVSEVPSGAHPLFLHSFSTRSLMNYRDLSVWQKARALTRDVYSMTQEFPRREMFGISAQMRDAALSIVSNIAEGAGRWSRREFRHFVVVARGSAYELDAQVVVALDNGYIDEKAADTMNKRITEIVRMLNGLIRYLADR